MNRARMGGSRVGVGDLHSQTNSASVVRPGIDLQEARGVFHRESNRVVVACESRGPADNHTRVIGGSDRRRHNLGSRGSVVVDRCLKRVECRRGRVQHRLEILQRQGDVVLIGGRQ